MRILVTGAGGFIGIRLVQRLLRDGHEVVAFVRTIRGELKLPRPGLKVVRGDMTDTGSLDEAVAGCEVIVHLANATAITDWAKARAINVEGTRQLLQAARRAGVRRMVFTSTLSALREQRGPYGQTKLEAEVLVRESGLPFVILRPSLVYGAHGIGLVANLAAYLRGLPAVPVIGDGRIELDPIHLNDVNEIIVQCLTRDDVLGKAYDLLGPDRVTFNEFLARLSAEIGVKKPLVHLPGGPMLFAARIASKFLANPPITEDNVLGLTSPAQVDRESAVRDFKIARTSLDQGLRDVLMEPQPGEEGAIAPGRVGVPVAPLMRAMPRPSRSVRVGVVGLGKLGVAHTAVLSMVPNVELVGVSDLAPALGKSLRGMGFKAPFYATVNELLAQAKPDAVWVCTPPHVHEPVARMCVEAGVAAFVEKPLAHSVESAQRLADLAARPGAKVSCGYTLAFWPSFAAAQHAIASGVLGEVRSGRSSMFLSQVFAAPKGWIGDPAKSGGGVVANISSHLLFVLRWCLGQPVAVKAEWKKLYGDVEDEVTAVFRLSNGAEVTFESSWSVLGYPMSATTFEVLGDNGRLTVTNESIELDLEESRGGWSSGRTRLLHPELPQPSRFDLNGEAYVLEDAAFAAWVAGGDEPPGTAALGLDVQRMMGALYDSCARNGAEVEVVR
ncbi:MAG: Gfo/Idh/MocA family oxidoreductase [Candidatus Eisenbacteria bacterium]